MSESISIGALTAIAVLVFSYVGAAIMGGGVEEVFMFGLALLCGVIAACTVVVVRRLDALLGKNKEETKENNDEH